VAISHQQRQHFFLGGGGLGFGIQCLSNVVGSAKGRFFCFVCLVCWLCLCVCVWEFGCGLCGSVVMIFLLDLGSEGIIFFEA
jgi:hypothetical protein